MYNLAPAHSPTIYSSDNPQQQLSTSPGAPLGPAQAVCVPPRKRNRQPRSNSYALIPCDSESSSLSSASQKVPASSSRVSQEKRWPCGLHGCTKRYSRSHDLVRHIDTAHYAALFGAPDDAILAAGVPPEQLARVRELFARRNACAVCGKAFSRQDALVRHRAEQGHRIVAHAPAVAPPPGYQWALVPVPAEHAAPLTVAPSADAAAGPFMSPLDMHPVRSYTPLEHDEVSPQVPTPLDFFGAPSPRVEDVLASSGVGEVAEFGGLDTIPSLDDWETLITLWSDGCEAR